MKKRNCRFTPEEKEIHAAAVRIRKKTDQELVEYVDQGRKKAYSNGVEVFLRDVDGVRGIGVVTRKKLHDLAEERGYIGL